VVVLISNRYTVHAMMTLIVIGVVAVNMSARDVRAEDFGQQSLLYQMVATDGLYTLETVEAGTPLVTLGQSTSYTGIALDSRRHIDLNYLDEPYVTPVVGETPGEEVPERTIVAERTDSTTHTVESGDTLGQIAETYGLNLSTILWANDLTYTSTLNLGQEITIPPKDGVSYTVESGDTLSSIASDYSITTADIMSENGLTSANRLSIGDELFLPNAEPPSPASTTRTTASITTLFTPPEPTSTAPSTSAPSADGWVWPTDWRVITQYYGWRHTGIDVDGHYETNSYAARGGVVVYSGWRNGYGITVEIDHGDGFMTRYAHHAQNYVSVGDVVYAGQAIAQTGTTGFSTGTHLHFEIIKGGRFLNPLDYVR
jgi:murein DD-endopeptidase MepM/ murein hydrolase activator NlpD